MGGGKMPHIRFAKGYVMLKEWVEGNCLGKVGKEEAGGRAVENSL